MKSVARPKAAVQGSAGKAAALPWSKCRELIPVNAADIPKNYEVTPVRKRVRYTREVPPQRHIDRVDGWCMFPTLWSGDYVLWEPAEFRIRKGDDLSAPAMQATYESAIAAFNRKIVVLFLDGKLMVKRLQFAMSKLTQAAVVCDSHAVHGPIFIALDGTADYELYVFGVVTNFVAFCRDAEMLPAELREEWEAHLFSFGSEAYALKNGTPQTRESANEFARLNPDFVETRIHEVAAFARREFVRMPESAVSA